MKLLVKIKFIVLLHVTIFVITSCGKSDPPPASVTPLSTVSLTTTTLFIITGNSAQSGGNIVSDGGVPVTARGLCWNTSPNPTIANNKTNDGTGTGTFFGKMTGLNFSTRYYVRAYATNALGTVYGNELSFITAATILLPFINTDFPTSITPESAISGGSVASDGGAIVTARGICWNTSPNPTILNSKTTDGTGEGSFISNITGLTAKKLYYVRAYAINSAGTGYGIEYSFITPEPSTLYIGGRDNNFYAINALTGQLKWKHSGTKPFAAGPCYANGKIYAASWDNFLYCMDTLNGNVNWSFKTGSSIDCDPVYDNGTIYFGSNDYYMYAVDAATGALKWKFLAGFNLESSPAVSNGVVYFGSDDSKVYALNAATGQMLWNYLTGDVIIYSGPALANGVLYIGSRDGYLYAINMNNGSLKWRFLCNSPLDHSSATVANDIVYITGSQYPGTVSAGGIYAVNAITGQLVWQKFPGVFFYSSPQVVDGKLYITKEAQEMLAIDAATGVSIWTKNILPNGASPVVINGTVFIGGGGTGFVYAMDALTGVNRWTYNIPGSVVTSGACIVTPSGEKYTGRSGMQQ